MKIVVIGGTGLIGSKTVAILRQGDHEVVAASPKSGVNSITGEGLKETMAGAQVLIDLTNSPSFEDKAVLEFFETSGNSPLEGDGFEPSVPQQIRSAFQDSQSRLRSQFDGLANQEPQVRIHLPPAQSPLRT